MADNKPTTTYYQNLGGINLKASKYEMNTAQFLDLRNLDFDVPKALQKRPGSTFGIGSSNSTSGPIATMFEFQKLTGESYIVTASDTALFYVAANAFTLLSPGWNNGQPPDMLTFVNKLWIANGQKYSWWNGNSGTILPASLPGQASPLQVNLDAGSGSATWMLVGGATMLVWAGASSASFTARGVYVAYSYLRSDGYQGPANFLQDAKNVVANNFPISTNGAEYFNTYTLLAGFSTISGRGISAINIWVATDTVDASSPTDLAVGNAQVGSLGYLTGFSANRKYMSVTLKPSADLSRFALYATVDAASFVPRFVFDGYTALGDATLFTYPFFFNSFATYAPVAIQNGFSGMAYDVFATYTPKYIELSNNTMFYSGFSNAPSRVTFSEIGQPETILPESFFEVRTNDGDRTYGLQTFNNYLLILKEHSFHKLIGTNADNYQLVQLSTDYGCLSQRTILTIDQSAYWLDRKGILQFTGANWSIISGPIENVFRRMNVDAAKEKATAVHHIYRNQIWFGIPVDGSTVNNLTVVYDYLVQAWTFFDGYNASSYAYMKGSLNRQTAWRGDYSGMIHFTGESFMQDSNQGITCLALSHFENQGGQNQTTIWRRFFLDVASVAGASTAIRCQTYSNYDSTTINSTFSVFQNQFQTRAEFGVVAKSFAVQMRHSSTNLPLLINGFAIASRGLRNV